MKSAMLHQECWFHTAMWTHSTAPRTTPDSTNTGLTCMALERQATKEGDDLNRQSVIKKSRLYCQFFPVSVFIICQFPSSLKKKKKGGKEKNRYNTIWIKITSNRDKSHAFIVVRKPTTCFCSQHVLHKPLTVQL